MSTKTLSPTRLVYGRHPVREALRGAGRQVQSVMAAVGRDPGPLLQQAERRQIPVQRCTLAELDALCQSCSHQGIAAVVGEFPYLELEDLLQGRAGHNRRPPLLLVLDSVSDPQNLGSILRSALVLGASGAVLPKDRAAGITAAVVRVSAGASEHLPCARVTNLARALQQIREAGIWVAGAVESGGQSPESADLTVPLALVLGNEQRGIRPLVLRQCDLLLTISAPGAIASLNVAMAAAVLCYEAARQRRTATVPPTA